MGILYCSEYEVIFSISVVVQVIQMHPVCADLVLIITY